MKTYTPIIAGCAVLALALLLLPASDSDEQMQEDNEHSIEMRRPPIRMTGHTERQPPTPPSKPAPPEEPAMTKEQFDQLPRTDQEQVLEDFITAFWQKETGVADPLEPVTEYLSLDLFGRPYLHTLSESEFGRLAPEDQEQAIAEVIDSAQERRRYTNDLIAQAQEGLASEDHARAEACLISALESGRELNADREGLFITRVVGIACQTEALNEMVKLYRQTGEHAKVQRAEEQLRDLATEKDEMRRIAEQQAMQ